MKREKLLTLELPKNPTLGNLAEPTSKYLLFVGDHIANVIRDKDTSAGDKKILKEFIVHLLHCVNLLQVLTALVRVDAKMAKRNNHNGKVNTRRKK